MTRIEQTEPLTWGVGGQTPSRFSAYRLARSFRERWETVRVVRTVEDNGETWYTVEYDWRRPKDSALALLSKR